MPGNVDPKNPIKGQLHIDATEFQTKDITPEEILSLTKVHEGVDKAVDCVLNLKQETVEEAGISIKEVQRLGQFKAEYDRLGVFVEPAYKMAEVLRETRLLRGHDVGTILAEMAAQAKRRASRVPHGAEILGPLEDLMDYQYGPSAKALITKAKKEEEEEKAKAAMAALAAKAAGAQEPAEEPAETPAEEPVEEPVE